MGEDCNKEPFVGRISLHTSNSTTPKGLGWVVQSSMSAWLCEEEKNPRLRHGGSERNSISLATGRAGRCWLGGCTACSGCPGGSGPCRAIDTPGEGRGATVQPGKIDAHCTLVPKVTKCFHFYQFEEWKREMVANGNPAGDWRIRNLKMEVHRLVLDSF